MSDGFKKVAILAMGGTLSGIGEHRLDYIDYTPGARATAAIVAELPELQELAHITVEELASFNSSEIDVADWLEMRRRIEFYLNEARYDGVIITHGTNTMEETAYFLHLTARSDRPIVMTGAQRPYSAVGTDAAFNLINAVRVAADERSAGRGVLVVMNNQINNAREVAKTGTYCAETFQSGHIGFLGYVDNDGSVHYYRSTTKKHTMSSEFSLLPFTQLPKVAIVYSHAGADADIIDFLADSGRCQGIVMAGMGAGVFSMREQEALVRARRAGLHVVRSSRVGSGRVLGLKRYAPLGFLHADNLSPQKARLLLMLAASAHDDPAAMQRCFDEY